MLQNKKLLTLNTFHLKQKNGVDNLIKKATNNINKAKSAICDSISEEVKGKVFQTIAFVRSMIFGV